MTKTATDDRVVAFKKMHGLGNDFLVVDARARVFAPNRETVERLADRRRGVGCDQLIVLEPSARAHLFMRIYNSDGTEAEACGNATRCAAALLATEGVTTPQIETLRGVLSVKPTADRKGMFTVNMGAPIFEPAQIPVVAEDGFALPDMLAHLDAPVAVGMGNPHCVFVTDAAVIDSLDVRSLGKMVEVHPIFPNHTNVHFIAVIGHNKIRQRVFERGAGVTGASGSGACAGAVAAMRLGLVVGASVEVALDGGSLWIDWAGGEQDAVFMTGPWALSYTGRLDLDHYGDA